MSFAVGSLVKARNREWVVLPESDENVLVVRPLGGTDDETTGILTALETVAQAKFNLPDPGMLGDYNSCRLLRDAVRLGFRSSAGPFRSFARIAVEPRPYQLVPLLMALKLDPIRILIADDVGVGKTIEACLIAKEVIDRGEVSRLAVLCLPHLAEQWQDELKEKFNIDAELVLPSTARKLERHCAINQSLFDIFPYVVVSMDFIKSDRYRTEFTNNCPDLVIVDEAHTCAYSLEARSGRHQRHRLITELAKKPDRHIILVTATPHSGKEAAFRSLLVTLLEDFSTLPDDLLGKENEHHRRRIAQYFVQRRRRDIENYMDKDTPFPERDESEESYSLSPDYKKFLNRVLNYARETVLVPELGKFQQRVRWWSALALLRSIASSPAAAAATLRSRAATADTETTEDADSVGKLSVLDLDDDDSMEQTDSSPGSDVGEHADDEERNRRRLLEMARQAETLKGSKDKKLQEAVKIIDKIVRDGYHPIVFCRFIPTAEYVAEELRKHFKQKVEVTAVTGTLPPAEREERVTKLGESDKRVLVCTDCLSEGINLQDKFDAVMHYDLSWNPTRHEQREGRVDRFGQKRDTVRVVSFYGIDNQIDGIVLNVLIRKHKQIRSSLGISVPVPAETDKVIEAIFEGLLLREQSGGVSAQQLLPGLEEYFQPQKEELHRKWDHARDQMEKRSRTMFAQQSIKVGEVAAELKAAQKAVGSGVDLEAFVEKALKMNGGVVSKSDGAIECDLRELPRALRESIGNLDKFQAHFDAAGRDKGIYLHRTHPIVEGLSNYVMTSALDPKTESDARRCGVIISKGVERRTTVILLRFRYHIITRQGKDEYPLLAEDCKVVAFEGAPGRAKWLNEESAEKLLELKPDDNITPDRARGFIQKIIDEFEPIRGHLNTIAEEHGKKLLDAHKRVREAAKAKNVTYRIEPNLPPDILGLYVYLPKN